MTRKIAAVLLLFAATLAAQPRRILYLTQSAGFVHSSIAESVATLEELARRSNGRLSVTPVGDAAMIRAEVLANYDAVFFFTTGELPLSATQKNDLLQFVRGGKGFGGAHSATDTLASWPEYLDLIGARFNGHPWVEEAGIDIEDPAHPGTRGMGTSFRIMEEFYQFRDFSRTRSRVLMTLDVATVNLQQPDVNANTRDFPLAWVHPYGNGRVFYTALGHFESTWRDERFRGALLEGLLWLTGQRDGDMTPRPPKLPLLSAAGVANAATWQFPGEISPGSLITIFGTSLTAGSSMTGDLRAPSHKLAGAEVTLEGMPVAISYASPWQINVWMPAQLPAVTQPTLAVDVAGQKSQIRLSVSETTPGIFAVTPVPGAITVWATGLGSAPKEVTAQVNGSTATVLFSGAAPEWPWLYQVNIATQATSGRVDLTIGGKTATAEF